MTIITASTNAMKAWNAERNGVEPYDPISAKRIKLWSGVSLTSDRIVNLERQVKELYGKHETLADYVDSRIEQVFNYAQSAHIRLTEHEEVTLPKIMASQSGLIIAGSMLSLVGALAIFSPDFLYHHFSNLGAAGLSMLCRVMHQVVLILDAYK